MASTAEPVRIGPFTGGLNTYSDPNAIGDTECADINNFDIDLDGTLISRPPVTMLGGPSAVGFRILGYFTWTDGVAYLIGVNANGVYAYNFNLSTWSVVTNTIVATSMVQYANKAFLVSPPLSGSASGSWDPTSGFVAIASMPHGNTAAIYKERVYIGTGIGHANPSRLLYCPAGNPGGVWAAGDLIDVNNGDGQNIIEILNYNGALVVFKQNSTYMFAYDSQPGKGATQILSSTVGVTDKDCIAVSENVLYVMYSGDVYSVINWNWEMLNVKVPFKYVNAHLNLTHTNYSLSIVGTRLLCKYFDTYYMYGIKTRAWCIWTFTANANLLPSRFIKFPIADAVTGIEKYYASSSLFAVTQTKSLHLFKDTYTELDKENMNVSIRSKTYNFNAAYSYKRLFWWGVDLLSNSVINAKLKPTAYGQPVKWSQLIVYTWAQLSTATWNAPLQVSLDVSDSADIKNITGIRMFVKFLKSIRFRQLAFDMSSVVDGSTLTGPLRLFSITAFVTTKETVNKKIS